MTDARLTTAVNVDGSLQVHFQFQASNWARATFPVTLPAGAHPLTVQVDGHWLSQLTLNESDTGAAVLELPVPAGTGEAVHVFDLVYTLPGGKTVPWQTAASPSPGLPVAAAPVPANVAVAAGRPPTGHELLSLARPGRRGHVGAWVMRIAAKLPGGLAKPWHEGHEDSAAQMQALERCVPGGAQGPCRADTTTAHRA